MERNIMRLAITKAFTKELNKAFKAHNLPYTAQFLYCDYSPDIMDYDSRIGKYKTIMVEYPPEYYAMPMYLTGCDLRIAYTPGDTIETYFASLLTYIEI